MRCLCRIVGFFLLGIAVCLIGADGPASAQGKSAQADKGLEKAIQMAPSQAYEKLLMAFEKSQRKGQTMQKGGKRGSQKGGKSKGKGP